MIKNTIRELLITFVLSSSILLSTGIPRLADEDSLVEVAPVPDPELPPKEGCYDLRDKMFSQCLSEIKERPELGTTIFDCKSIRDKQNIYCLCQGEVLAKHKFICSDDCNINHVQCVTEVGYNFLECMEKESDFEYCGGDKEVGLTKCDDQIKACFKAKFPVDLIA